MVAALGFLGPNRAIATRLFPARRGCFSSPLQCRNPARGGKQSTPSPANTRSWKSRCKGVCRVRGRGREHPAMEARRQQAGGVGEGHQAGGGNPSVAHLTYTPDRRFLYFAASDGKGIWRHDFEKEAPKTYGIQIESVACIGFARTANRGSRRSQRSDRSYGYDRTAGTTLGWRERTCGSTPMLRTWCSAPKGTGWPRLQTTARFTSSTGKD